MNAKSLSRIGRALATGGLSEVFRDRSVQQAETTPTTSYAEIHDHRSHAVVGYIPDEVFDSIVRRTGETTWITKEQSAAVREHPQFITKAESEASLRERSGSTPKETP